MDHTSFNETRASKGDLQFDLWNVEVSDTDRWDTLKEDIKTHGLRNSLLIAIAPTATIASICGSYECIEPQLSNLFKRETYLVNSFKLTHTLLRNLEN